MKKASWEKRFDEKFNRRMALAITGGEIDDIKWLREEIKQLISQQISLTKKEMGKALRKTEKKTRGHTMPVWRKGNECANCGVDISKRDRRASYCFDCARKINRKESKDINYIKVFNRIVKKQNQDIDNYLERK